MRILKLFKNHQPNTRGDTIIEVLISMSILALVLGTAYAVSSHSLQTGTAAGQRNQALGYAQTQIEFIKQAQSTNSTAMSLYADPSGPEFCISTNGSYNIAPADAPPGTQDPCLSYDFDTYTVRVRYNDSLKVFTVKLWWAAANLSAEQSSLVLYYKLPGGFQLPPTVTTDPANDITTSSMTLHGTVNPNGVNVSSCYFRYGLTSSYGSTVNSSCSSTTPSPISAPITGLNSNTNYHFRACAVNSVGTTCGDDREAPTPGSSSTSTSTSSTSSTSGSTSTSTSSSGSGGCPNPQFGGDGTSSPPNPCVRSVVAGRPSGGGPGDMYFNIFLDHCYDGIGVSYPGGSLSQPWPGGGPPGGDNISVSYTVGDASSSGGTVTVTCSGNGTSVGSTPVSAYSGSGSTSTSTSTSTTSSTTSSAGGNLTKTVCYFPEDGSWFIYSGQPCTNIGGQLRTACISPSGGLVNWGAC